ncbi:hypothetical protein NFI96_006110 [Prochilodus magdalenae]|nr:hypothetical protein NFI96_006110 [Prochilodus magdalenae]
MCGYFGYSVCVCVCGNPRCHLQWCHITALAHVQFIRESEPDGSWHRHPGIGPCPLGIRIHCWSNQAGTVGTRHDGYITSAASRLTLMPHHSGTGTEMKSCVCVLQQWTSNSELVNDLHMTYINHKAGTRCNADPNARSVSGMASFGKLTDYFSRRRSRDELLSRRDGRRSGSYCCTLTEARPTIHNIVVATGTWTVCQYNNTENGHVKTVIIHDVVPIVYMVPPAFNRVTVHDSIDTASWPMIHLSGFCPCPPTLLHIISSPSSCVVLGYSPWGLFAEDELLLQCFSHGCLMASWFGKQHSLFKGWLSLPDRDAELGCQYAYPLSLCSHLSGSIVLTDSADGTFPIRHCGAVVTARSSQCCIACTFTFRGQGGGWL